MDKGIFDRVAVFLAPGSIFRSDRVMGSLILLMTFVLSWFGVTSPEVIQSITAVIDQSLNGTARIAIELGAIVTAIGVARRSISSRSF